MRKWLLLLASLPILDCRFTYISLPVKPVKEYHKDFDWSDEWNGATLCAWAVHFGAHVSRQNPTIQVINRANGQPRLRVTLTQSKMYVDSRLDGIPLPSTTTWYHWCVSWSARNDGFGVFFNGEAVAQVTTDTTGIANGEKSTFCIGSTNTYVFAGQLASIQLYSRVLSAREVELESCGRCADCAPLIPWKTLTDAITTYPVDRSPIELEPPTGVSAGLESQISIHVAWPRDKPSQQFDYYIIQLTNVTSQKFISKTHYITIGDLSPETVYSVKVGTKSRCICGAPEVWSTAVEIKTLPVPEDVKGLRIAKSTNDSIHLEWDKPSRVIDKYKMIMYPTYDTSTQTHKQLPPEPTTYNFTGLTPNTKYTILLATAGFTGTSQYARITGKTLSTAVPEIEVNLKVVVKPEYNVDVRWETDVVLPHNFFYRLEIESSGTTTLRKDKKLQLSPITTTDEGTILKDLEPKGFYTLSLELCPDETSDCRHLDSSHFYLGEAQEFRYQQAYKHVRFEQLTPQDIKELVAQMTAESSATVNVEIETLFPNTLAFLARVTVFNLRNGRLEQGELWKLLQRAQGQAFGEVTMVNFQLIPVIPKGCHQEIEIEPGKGEFTWPYVTATVTLPCNISYPVVGENRTRECIPHSWGNSDYSACPYAKSTSGDIQRLLDTEITSASAAFEVSKKLTEITAGEMNDETIGMTSAVISNILQAANNPNISFTPIVAENLAGALDNIQSLTKEQLSDGSLDSARSIVGDVEAYCESIVAPEDDTNDDDETELVAFTSPALKLSVVRVLEESGNIQINTNGTNSTLSISLHEKEKGIEEGLNKISVQVPGNLISGNRSNVFVAVYNNKGLFQQEGNGAEEAFDIPVISISSNNIPGDTKLKKKVTFSLVLEHNDTMSKPACVYWDTKTHKWSTEGVDLVFTDGISLICETEHLTSFSALLLPGQNDYILDIISQIGATVSILCLLFTATLLFFVRSVRELLSTKIHINFSLALLFALTLFMINSNTARPGTYCKVVACLTHYFFLSSFLWMGVEGVGLYRAVVLVFNGGSTSSFLLGATLVGWLTPLPVVVVLGAIPANIYTTHADLGMCWLTRSWMYGVFYGPLVAMIMFNLLIFARVLWEIMANKRQRNKPGDRLVELRIAFSIMSLLGLTWFFGIVQVVSPHLVVQYLFSITNTLQGVAVFIFYCLYNGNIRTALWRVVHGQALNPSSMSSVPSNHKKKKGISIRKSVARKISIVKYHIDGNPFTFSLGDPVVSQNGDGTKRKRMERKEWKKLKKTGDIKHEFNKKLSTSAGATVINSVETEGLTQITTISLSCPSPASNRSSQELQRIEESELENRSRGSSFTKLDNDREELVAQL